MKELFIGGRPAKSTIRVARHVGVVPAELDLRAASLEAMKEIIVGGMPATSTNKFVTGIFGKLSHGTVLSCEVQLSTRLGFGTLYKLKMATAQDAEWCVRYLNGSKGAATALGLESPIFVDSCGDSGWMWKT